MRPVLKADNLPPACAVFTKSGSLNLLEPSGLVQACNGIALPFYLSSNSVQENDATHPSYLSGRMVTQKVKVESPQ